LPPAIIKVLAGRGCGSTRRGAILRRTRLSVDQRRRSSWLIVAVRGAPSFKKRVPPHSVSPLLLPAGIRWPSRGGRLPHLFRGLEKFVDAEASEWI
ncbi:MAG: hypothetical protein ACXWMI_08715, partial [Syntrophales bacterium]